MAAASAPAVTALLLAAVLLLAAAPAAHAGSLRRLAAETTPKLSCYQTFVKNSEGADVQVAAVAVQAQSRFNGVQSSVASQGEATCMRALVKCAPGYNMALCTKADTDAGVWKHAYMATTQPVCAYYETEAVKSGVARDVYCCATDNCNLDRSVDEVTKVMAFADEAPSSKAATAEESD